MLMNFNPRSLAGATVLCPRAAIAWADFNPRSLTGATGRGNGFSKSFTISIHAPSRERHFVLMYLGEFDEFQSTLPHGSDAILLLISSLLLIFQSTLPHGSDTCANSSAGRGHKFQSTLPHGSDFLLWRAIGRPSNFNPRSLTGATVSITDTEVKTVISIHAPSRERRTDRLLNEY